MAKIKTNSTESRTLVTRRDTLPPKLLRGKFDQRKIDSKRETLCQMT